MAGRLAKFWGGLALVALLAACGGGVSIDGDIPADNRERLENAGILPDSDRDTIWDLFAGGADPNTTVEVNRYLWNASLDILDFMPVEGADPFTGIIVFGYGTPPGGSRSYRATVFVQDPALEARSLRVAVQSRGGAVARETARQIEDAILTRARQLRLADGNL